jgi:hypothetical protein
LFDFRFGGLCRVGYFVWTKSFSFAIVGGMDVASVIVTSLLLADINILAFVLPRLWSFALWLGWDAMGCAT